MMLDLGSYLQNDAHLIIRIIIALTKKAITNLDLTKKKQKNERLKKKKKPQKKLKNTRT